MSSQFVNLSIIYYKPRAVWALQAYAGADISFGNYGFLNRTQVERYRCVRFKELNLAFSGYSDLGSIVRTIMHEDVHGLGFAGLIDNIKSWEYGVAYTNLLISQCRMSDIGITPDIVATTILFFLPINVSIVYFKNSLDIAILNDCSRKCP